jgi:hypothetical protein
MRELIYFISLMAMYFLGWAVAHNTVAKECERLGAFYVGTKTYKCIAIEEKKND